MRRLSDDVKRRIVEHLACYIQPNEVSDLIQQEFGIPITARHVRAYDPASFQFAGSHRWIEYYSLVQKRFEDKIGSIPIRHRAYRLAKLQSVLDGALKRGNEWLALKILEQAAKEMGNYYVRSAREG